MPLRTKLFVTLDTSQVLRSALTSALANISSMFVTHETSQPGSEPPGLMSFPSDQVMHAERAEVDTYKYL